jgi:hypothetical protein
MRAEEVFTPSQLNELESVKIDLLKFLGRSLVMGPVPFKRYENIVFAGGAFTSHFQKEPMKDLDMFVLNNDEAIVKSLTGVTGHFKPGPDINESPIGYQNNPRILRVVTNTKSGIQLIITDYKTREELIDHFDFMHCRVSMVYERTAAGTNHFKNVMYISKNVFKYIKEKTLVPNPKASPAPQQWRYDKFMKRGWKLSNPEDYPISFQAMNRRPYGLGPWTGGVAAPLNMKHVRTNGLKITNGGNPCSEVVLDNETYEAKPFTMKDAEDWAQAVEQQSQQRLAKYDEDGDFDELFKILSDDWKDMR